MDLKIKGIKKYTLNTFAKAVPSGKEFVREEDFESQQLLLSIMESILKREMELDPIFHFYLRNPIVRNQTYLLLGINYISPHFTTGQINSMEEIYHIIRSISKTQLMKRIEESKIKLLNRIKLYLNSDFNIGSIRLKDQLFGNSKYGSDRLGNLEKIERIHEGMIVQVHELVSKICNGEASFYHIHDGLIDISNSNEKPHSIPDIVNQYVEDNQTASSKKYSILTCAYTFDDAQYLEREIILPIFDGYIGKFGRSVLFKTPRLDNEHLYHMASHYDQESNLLFITVLGNKRELASILKKIQFMMETIEFDHMDFSLSKIMFENEYRFNFDDCNGLISHLMTQKGEYRNPAFFLEEVQNIRLEAFYKLKDKIRLVGTYMLEGD